MQQRTVYKLISLIITTLILGLIGWAIFIGRQQQELVSNVDDVGYVNTPGRGTFGVGENIFRGLLGGALDNIPEESIATTTPQFTPTLERVYNLPTAGFDIEDTGILFTDRATGYVFRKRFESDSAERIHQLTIPQVYESYFTENSVIRRYVNVEESVVTSITSLSEEEGEERFLPMHIASIAMNTSRDKLVYNVVTARGSSVIVSNTDGSDADVIFESKLQGWEVLWDGEYILINQKASYNIPGTAYRIDPANGDTVIVAQQVHGLSARLSPDGERLLYSSTDEEGRSVLFLKDLSTGESSSLFITGLVEKCAWTPDSLEIYCGLPTEIPDGIYPDDWYQGAIYFRDSLWKIDAEKRLISEVFPITSRSGVVLDMDKVIISKDSSRLLFINRLDQTLWSITLSEKESEN
tara:strand:+ start:234 stop:1463 length:1230 start_codon:yes stop_codon:yes gene_type:complete